MSVMFYESSVLYWLLFFAMGALPQGTIITTPDVLSIPYIKKALTDCNQQLINAKNLVTPQELRGDNGCFFAPFPEQFNPYTMICPDIDTACCALTLTDNDDPPDSFSNMNGKGGDFDVWARKKEYRTYIHIPSFNIKCDASSHIVSYNNLHDPDYKYQNNNPTQHPELIVDSERDLYGYTKAPYANSLYTKIPCKFPYIAPTAILPCCGYNLAEVYTKKPFNLSDCERKAQQTMLFMDAPFIYSKISMKVCCNYQITVDISRTAFPQTCLYINGKKVDEKDQKDLSGLVAAGGRVMTSFGLSAVGHGNFAPSGDNLHWNGQAN
ncbi:18608_t:CDS:2 [Dentiscutata erythropus]|uniref:18608_t:CDS:1 n=1 Tax=Dentiscutata erythropus TaxID=1348616 RepID=A0A9N9IJ10_9GLOM|nr:18608_t:CDS:2 [Dentiscutata erythropus]